MQYRCCYKTQFLEKMSEEENYSNFLNNSNLLADPNISFKSTKILPATLNLKTENNHTENEWFQSDFFDIRYNTLQILDQSEFSYIWKNKFCDINKKKLLKEILYTLLRTMIMMEEDKIAFINVLSYQDITLSVQRINQSELKILKNVHSHNGNILFVF
jgi:hypothetical protein